MADEEDDPGAVTLLQWFAGIVVDGTEWIAGILADDVIRRAVLTDLGLDPLPGRPIDEEELLGRMSDDLTAVRAFAEANAGQADIATIAASVETIARIVDVMAGQIETVSSTMPEGRGAVEFFTALLHLFVIDTVRYRHPAFYAFARAAQIFSDEALAIDWDALSGLIADFFSPFHLKTQHDATLATPWLMALVTGARQLIDRLNKGPDCPEDGDQPSEHDKALFSALYGWDPDPTLPPELQPAERIAERTMTMFVGDQLGRSASLSIALVPEEHDGPGLLLAVGGQTAVGSIDTDDDGPNPGVRLTIGSGSAVAAYIPLQGSVSAARSFGPDGLTLTAEVAGARKKRVIGPTDGTRLEAGQVLFDFGVLGDRAVARLGVRDAALVVDLSSSDSFLSDVVGTGELRVPFSLVLGVDTAHGLFIEGGTALAATVPVNKTVAGIRFDSISLGLEVPDSAAMRLVVTAKLGVHLGAFQASVDQLGFSLDIDFAGGNFAIADIDSSFHPPKGIGLSFGFERVRGGGYLYLDPAKGEYAGALQLDCGTFCLKALGILTTKGLPNDEWALLLVLYATITPPVGAMGWVLTGVGGVIGVNHSASEEAFRRGLRTKALDDVLFPTDPVANAPRILSTLRTVFPVTADTAIVGIAAEFQYLSSRRVTIRAGVILQLGSSGPERVVILGQLKVSAPGEKNGVLTLNADLFGLVEWGEHQLRIAIDTQLYDSKIGFKNTTFTITGSLSVRLTLGRDSMVLFTAGGFHPDFEVPVDLGLPAKLDRFGFKLNKGIARMTLAGYAALTPCTMQFGAKLDLVAKKFGFSVEVSGSIDALLDQEHGRFRADLTIMGALKRGNTALMMIELKLSLSGPGPFRAKGSAKFKLLFFSKTIKFDESFGHDEQVALPLADALAILVAELSDSASWGGAPIDRAMVALREPAPGSGRILHPLSEIAVDQRTIPLGLMLDRIGQNRIRGPRRLQIEAVLVGGERNTTPEPIRNEFARAQFVDMPDDEALALPSFERITSGAVVVPSGLEAGTHREQAVVYETIYPFAEDRPPTKQPYHPSFGHVALVAERGAIARAASPVQGSPLFAAELPEIKVGVRDRSYTIADRNTLAPAGDTIAVPLHEALDQLAAADASGLRMVLVEAHEVMR